jgi:hypothetical protein
VAGCNSAASYGLLTVIVVCNVCFLARNACLTRQVQRWVTLITTNGQHHQLPAHGAGLGSVTPSVLDAGCSHEAKELNGRH